MDSCSTSDGMLSGCLARVICGQQGWGGRWMKMGTGTRGRSKRRHIVGNLFITSSSLGI